MTTTRTFADYGVDPAIVEALLRDGIKAPFTIQALTLEEALAGRDICGKAKTGSGKTLAFGIPVLMRTPEASPGRPASLVLVPTRELATQVTDVLAPLGTAIGRRVSAVYGGADMAHQIEAVRAGLDVVVATPGRLIHLVDRGGSPPDAARTPGPAGADRVARMGLRAPA